MKKQNPNFTRKHLIYFPILHIIKRYKDVMNVKLEEFFANKKLLRKIIKKILLIITFTVALILPSLILIGFGGLSPVPSHWPPPFSSELPSLLW